MSILTNLLILLILIAIVYFIYKYFNKKNGMENESECVYLHKEDGANYPWLDNVHKGLKKIQFMEPPNSGVWRDYTTETWKAHCRVIDHHPRGLVQAHMHAFVNPKTRFARLKFIFNDGQSVISDPKNSHIFRQIYEKEAKYFARLNK